ncbi:hypothetical protein BH23ACT6_BH23ACT6_13470 [soil metagenome]
MRSSIGDVGAGGDELHASTRQPIGHLAEQHGCQACPSQGANDTYEAEFGHCLPHPDADDPVIAARVPIHRDQVEVWVEFVVPQGIGHASGCVLPPFGSRHILAQSVVELRERGQVCVDHPEKVMPSCRHRLGYNRDSFSVDADRTR